MSNIRSFWRVLREMVQTFPRNTNPFDFWEASRAASSSISAAVSSIFQEPQSSAGDKPALSKQCFSGQPFSKRISKRSKKYWVSPSEWSQLVDDYKLFSAFIDTDWDKLSESSRQILVDLAQSQLNKSTRAMNRKTEGFLKIRLRTVSLQYACLLLEQESGRNLIGELISSANEIFYGILEKAGIVCKWDADRSFRSKAKEIVALAELKAKQITVSSPSQAWKMFDNAWDKIASSFPDDSEASEDCLKPGCSVKGHS